MALSILSVSDHFSETEVFCWIQSFFTSMGVYPFLSGFKLKFSLQGLKGPWAETGNSTNGITKSYSKDCIYKYLYFSLISKNNNFKRKRHIHR